MPDFLAPPVLLTLLYALLTATYGFAARRMRCSGHVEMARYYVASAILHGLIALCHLFHA